jgi:hypothetical protein
MKTVAALILFTLILAVFAPAFAQPFEVDRIILVNSTEREGRIISVDAADIQFQENPRGKTKLIPLAEVRQVTWANGQVTNWSVVEDPLLGEYPGDERFVRTSGRHRRDDLELSRGEVTYNAFGRGIMAGSIATFFTSDADEKKMAFAAGFLAHFSISLYAGW